MGIKQRLEAMLQGRKLLDADVIEKERLYRDALAEIESLQAFRRDAVAEAAAALDSRSNSRCVYALETIFRRG